MAATYNIDNSRDIDKVRKRLADNSGADYSVPGIQVLDPQGVMNSDEEIVGMVAAYGIDKATGFLARSMMAFYAQEPDSLTQANGTTVSFRDRFAAMKELVAAYLPTDATTLTGKRNETATTTVENIPTW